MRVFVAYLNVALLGGGLVFMTSYHPSRIRGPLGWLGASALGFDDAAGRLAGFVLVQAVAGEAEIQEPFMLPLELSTDVLHVGWAILKPQP